VLVLVTDDHLPTHTVIENWMTLLHAYDLEHKRIVLVTLRTGSPMSSHGQGKEVQVLPGHRHQHLHNYSTIEWHVTMSGLAVPLFPSSPLHSRPSDQWIERFGPILLAILRAAKFPFSSLVYREKIKRDDRDSSSSSFGTPPRPLQMTSRLRSCVQQIFCQLTTCTESAAGTAKTARRRIMSPVELNHLQIRIFGRPLSDNQLHQLIRQVKVNTAFTAVPWEQEQEQEEEEGGGGGAGARQVQLLEKGLTANEFEYLITKMIEKDAPEMIYALLEGGCTLGSGFEKATDKEQEEGGLGWWLRFQLVQNAISKWWLTSLSLILPGACMPALRLSERLTVSNISSGATPGPEERNTERIRSRVNMATGAVSLVALAALVKSWRSGRSSAGGEKVPVVDEQEAWKAKGLGISTTVLSPASWAYEMGKWTGTAVLMMERAIDMGGQTYKETQKLWNR